MILYRIKSHYFNKSIINPLVDCGCTMFTNSVHLTTTKQFYILNITLFYRITILKQYSKAIKYRYNITNKWQLCLFPPLFSSNFLSAHFMLKNDDEKFSHHALSFKIYVCAISITLIWRAALRF